MLTTMIYSIKVTMPRRKTGRKNNKIDTAMRERIIASVFDDGMNFASAARRLFLPESTVRHVVNEFEAGKLEQKPRGGSKNKKMENEHFIWLQEQVSV